MRSTSGCWTGRCNTRLPFSRSLARLLILTLIQFSNASELYFSPDGGIRDQIIKRINITKSAIELAMYSLTSGDIAEALANASRRGVQVRIVRDTSQSGEKN